MPRPILPLGHTLRGHGSAEFRGSEITASREHMKQGDFGMKILRPRNHVSRRRETTVREIYWKQNSREHGTSSSSGKNRRTAVSDLKKRVSVPLHWATRT